MRLFRVSCRALLLITLACLTAYAQEDGRTPNQNEDVLRIDTELVQTDVMVFDKQGRFVDNLGREQFELKVDGKVVPVSFFERVVAGSVDEDAQLAAARGGALRSADSTSTATTARPLDRGRIIVFFIDDMHLSFESLNRTRQTLTRFIESEMGQNDWVAIASASGQIGFLQQFTDDKAVLRAAMARLRVRPNLARDTEFPPMTELMALAIEHGDDPRVFGYFYAACMSRNGKFYPPSACAREVRSRAHQIVTLSRPVTTGTLNSLESLMRTSAELPGRKLVFFVSDGFLLDNKTSDVSYKLQRITDAAVRAGVVIYTVDARGLVSGSLDATGATPFDMDGRLENAQLREIPASQDALNALAADTGGRALRNTNVLDPFIRETIRETSRYYLLAWRPEDEGQRRGRFRRVEVSVRGRPDLTARVSRGFLDAPTRETPTTRAEAARAQREAAKTPEASMRDALAAAHPKRTLPVMLDLNYIDTPQHGTVLTASVQVEGDAFAFSKATSGKEEANVDVLGVVLNDQGKPAANFKTRLSVDALTSSNGASGSQASDIIYNYRAPLAPGIYQVRVAARDEKSGRTGSAMRWIEVPDLSARRLTLSSLLVGVQSIEPSKTKGDGADSLPQVQFSVDHRFPRTSRLRFLTVIYNAMSRDAGSTTAAAPDLALQVQIFRDDQPVVTTALRKVSTEGILDPARLPYEAEIALGSLPSGRYALQITVIDRLAKTSATHRARFEIE